MKLPYKHTILEPIEADPRKRFYLRPARIVSVTGDVTDPEHLKTDIPNQIQLLDDCELTILKNGENGQHASVLLDFGCEIHGSVRILTQHCQPNGVMVNVRFGESVSETLHRIGESGATSDHANRDFDLPLHILSSTDTNESGFRFVRIELLGENTMLQLRAVFGVLIVRDIEYAGSFESSDPLLNKIFDTCAYTAHLNMQEYMWDGIKRDRLVWIGDMHPEVMTVCSVFGANEVVPKSLDFAREMADPDRSDSYKWMNGIPSYSMWWLMCHYDYYMQNGDLEYLKTQHAYLSRLIPMLCELIGNDGIEHVPDWRFLDWPTNADNEAKHAGLQGLLCMSLDAAAVLADALGDAALAAVCREKTALMRTHAPTTNRKQAAAVMALAGIGDPAAIDCEVLAPGGGHGYSTFYSYYILAARALAGKTAEALDDLREYYGAMLRLGATTFWEDFNLDWIDEAGGWDGIAGIDAPVPEGKRDIHGDYGAYCYVGLRHSLCHGWSSAPTAFLMRHVLGIRILEAGCRKLAIKPQLCGLDYVKGTYPTPFGTVSVYADKNGVKIDAPEGIEIVK